MHIFIYILYIAHQLDKKYLFASYQQGYVEKTWGILNTTPSKLNIIKWDTVNLYEKKSLRSPPWGPTMGTTDEYGDIVKHICI